MRKIFEEILGTQNVLLDEPMSKHTTFKIGGAADYFLTPENEEQLKAVFKVAEEAKLPVFIMGNGSNLLVGDKGIRGVVICLFKKMDNIEVSENEIYVGCGALMSRVASVALNSGLAGLEFASGIPGTVGGGVYMNAGAYGFELKDIVKSVRFMDKGGIVSEIKCCDCEFGYRESVFSKKGYTVIGCTLTLVKDDKTAIRERMCDYTQRRVTKQPVEKPSAGSVFKRPEGYFAGALIEDAGLKGFSIGDAQVSEKHAGFIINNGAATARDVLDLIEYIKDVVYKKNGVILETEVKSVGEF